MLGHATPAVAEAAAAVLGEVGGAQALEALDRVAKQRRTLAAAIRTARRHISERIERGRPAEGEDAATRRLALFGPPRLEVNGQAVPPASWRSQRAFQVLVYLALHPRGANKDVLLERFWPGRQIAAGRRNFHPTLSYVRHVLPALPDVPILREGEIYRLNPEYPLACDAWEFEQALDSARAQRDTTARRAALRQATALARGPFLEGFYMDWADALQARMRDRLEKALLELADLEARAGSFDLALEAFRRAATLDEYRESTRIAVIECLVRLGERRSALVEYDRLKSTLRKELSVEPLPETEEAMQRLLRGEGVHGWPSKPPSESGQAEERQRIVESTQVGVNRP
jgi:DNA-binding SARP family transcriptional activator